jgi:hypothetical protein
VETQGNRFPFNSLRQLQEWNPPRLTFDVKESRIDNGTWKIDIASRSVTTPSDVVFQKILKSEDAKKLTERLNPRMVKWWLRRVAEAPSERRDNHRLKRQRDRAKYLARDCLLLAKAIRDAGEPPEAELLWPENLPDWRALPKMLAYYARMWKFASAPPKFSNWLPAIPAFIEAVKAITGREHYSEIAYMLNAIDAQFRPGASAHRGARNLGQMVYRDRKKHDAFMRELEKTRILIDDSGISPSDFEITRPPKNP